MRLKVGDLLTAKLGIQFLCKPGDSFFITELLTNTDGSYYVRVDNMHDLGQFVYDYELPLFTISSPPTLEYITNFFNKECTCGARSVKSTIHSNWCDHD